MLKQEQISFIKYMSRTLNRDPKYMSGDYAKMFIIEPIESNKHFVRNPYKPGNCDDIVCFSLTNGALPCRPDKTKMLIFNSEGNLTSVPVRHLK